MSLDVHEAARLLCLSEDQVYELVGDGELPSHEVQDQPRFSRVELLEWAAARRMRVMSELFDDDPNPGNGKRARLGRLLRAGGLHRDVAADDAPCALAALVLRMHLPEGVDGAAVAALVRARASVTPVGGSIAIPDTRSPIALPVSGPVVALGFLARPIDVKAPDGRPLRALFAVVSPSIRAHLHVLSQLATALHDTGLHGLVEQGAADDVILARVQALDALEQEKRA